MTVIVSIFIAELTDKDAILLLTLATKVRPRIAFAMGATAFTITSAIIVTIGYFLIQVLPIFWIKMIGGSVMIGYAVFEYFRRYEAEDRNDVFNRRMKGKGVRMFLGAVLLLMLLDLAGDATEVLTIVYVARFNNVLLVFLGSVIALVVASALETMIGSKLKKVLTGRRLRIFSWLVFLVIGSLIVGTTIL